MWCAHDLWSAWCLRAEKKGKTGVCGDLSLSSGIRRSGLGDPGWETRHGKRRERGPGRAGQSPRRGNKRQTSRQRPSPFFRPGQSIFQQYLLHCRIKLAYEHPIRWPVSPVPCLWAQVFPVWAPSLRSWLTWGHTERSHFHRSSGSARLDPVLTSQPPPSLSYPLAPTDTRAHPLYPSLSAPQRPGSCSLPGFCSSRPAADPLPSHLLALPHPHLPPSDPFLAHDGPARTHSPRRTPLRVRLGGRQQRSVPPARPSRLERSLAGRREEEVSGRHRTAAAHAARPTAVLDPIRARASWGDTCTSTWSLSPEL